MTLFLVSEFKVMSDHVSLTLSGLIKYLRNFCFYLKVLLLFLIFLIKLCTFFKKLDHLYLLKSFSINLYHLSRASVL